MHCATHSGTNGADRHGPCSYGAHREAEREIDQRKPGKEQRKAVNAGIFGVFTLLLVNPHKNDERHHYYHYVRYREGSQGSEM